MNSSQHEWETPQHIYDALNHEFHFTLDVCATPHNAKCKHYYTKADDALTQTWAGTCWMNPPYGRHISQWLQKAYQSSQANHATIVCLIPARTDTAWWHDCVMKAHQIRLIRGRLRFSNATHNAPFPSAIVVFQPNNHTPTFTAWHQPCPTPTPGPSASFTGPTTKPPT